MLKVPQPCIRLSTVGRYLLRIECFKNIYFIGGLHVTSCGILAKLSYDPLNTRGGFRTHLYL